MLHTRFFFFFHDPAPTEIYTLSLHDALPICSGAEDAGEPVAQGVVELDDGGERLADDVQFDAVRSEEHTSELQSRRDLVCRLLLEKKKKSTTTALGCASLRRRTASP